MLSEAKHPRIYQGKEIQRSFAAMKIAADCVENKRVTPIQLFSCKVAGRRTMKSSLRMTCPEDVTSAG